MNRTYQMGRPVMDAMETAGRDGAGEESGSWYSYSVSTIIVFTFAEYGVLFSIVFFLFIKIFFIV